VRKEREKKEGEGGKKDYWSKEVEDVPTALTTLKGPKNPPFWGRKSAGEGGGNEK